MNKPQEHKQYKNDLEERTRLLALNVRRFIKKLPRDIVNNEDAKQVVRSSGYVGANYIEANESLSKKDFGMRVKICRKEAKETRYWLQMFEQIPEELGVERDGLIRESIELLKIFSSILSKL
ncbi:MAG: four helix bundle protein [bacterium]|nr:four helix bundle protein [bacterium]